MEIFLSDRISSRSITGQNFKSIALLDLEIWQSWNVYFTDRAINGNLQTGMENFCQIWKILMKINLFEKFEVYWRLWTITILFSLILTLVCKIHNHDRWPNNFIQFRFSLPRHHNWQSLSSKDVSEQKLWRAKVENRTLFDDVIMTWWRHHMMSKFWQLMTNRI